MLALLLACYSHPSAGGASASARPPSVAAGQTPATPSTSVVARIDGIAFEHDLFEDGRFAPLFSLNLRVVEPPHLEREVYLRLEKLPFAGERAVLQGDCARFELLEARTDGDFWGGGFTDLSFGKGPCTFEPDAGERLVASVLGIERSEEFVEPGQEIPAGISLISHVLRLRVVAPKRWASFELQVHADPSARIGDRALVEGDCVTFALPNGWRDRFLWLAQLEGLAHHDRPCPSPEPE